MSDPSLLLQGALVTLLKGAHVVAGDRVYDAVPAGADFPYVTIGDDQVIGDDNDCGEISEVTSRIHVWSRAVGRPEMKTIAGAIRVALRAAAITLAGFTVTEVRLDQIQYLEDPDGLTHHAVIESTFFITHG